jgi:hypothetical protein
LPLIFSNKEGSDAGKLIVLCCRYQNQFGLLPFSAAQGLPPFTEIFMTRKGCVGDALFDKRVPGGFRKSENSLCKKKSMKIFILGLSVCRSSRNEILPV